jgi:hypothetical protein
MRFVAAILAILAPSLAQADILAIDDGTAEEVRGFGSAADIFAINSFPSTPGLLFVNAVQIAWGSPQLPGFFPNGSPVTVYVWGDPNGDGSPLDAIVLASVAGTVAAADTNTFISYSFSSPIAIPTSEFFVGFRATETAQQYPAASDTNNPIPHRSFIAEFDSGAGDPNNLGSASFSGFLGENGLAPGNFMIRADVTVVPEPSSVILLIISLILLLPLAKRSRMLARPCVRGRQS